MNYYLAFVGTEGPQPPEALAVMRREFPAYLEEMDRRGVRVFGRELTFPAAAATVRVRDGETLVTDGPFAETKEFVGGIDLLDCADLDEAIEVESKSPVVRFCPFEIRPLRHGLRLGPGASAFGRGDDSAGIPYLLAAWADGTRAARLEDEALVPDCAAWRTEQEARGALVFGSELGAPEAAVTLRFRDGELQLSDGPFVDVGAFIGSIDVVICPDGQQAIQLAATHPLARYRAIEVRPFHTEIG